LEAIIKEEGEGLGTVKEKLASRTKTILLIEDHEDVYKPLAFRLRRRGFNVLVAEDGRKGLTTARLELPHLIILDLDLPLLSGEEVCKAIREDDKEALNTIPIIMLTAKTSQTDRIVGRVIGANRYLTKPYDSEELMLHIETYLRIYAE